MNKIYKVVWNAARGCCVVGSEFIRSSHTGGCRCEQKRPGCTLKRTVLTALLAGGILLPLSGAQVGAFDWSWGDKPGHDQEEQVTQKEFDELKGNVSDLKENFDASKLKDHKQDAAIGDLKEDVSGLKDDFDASKVKDQKQDAAIEMGIHKDEAQDAAIAGGMIHDAMQDSAIIGGMIKDEQQDAAIEMGIHKDEAQDAAIAGGMIHDAMQDSAIIGGMIKDEQQDAAIEMGIHKDEAQDAAIAGGMIHDAMQDSAIIGGMIKDEQQDAAIEMGIHKDEAQDAAIAGGMIHDAMQDGAIIGGIIKDHQQDERLDAVEDKNTEQDSRLDVVEEDNADQQLQIDGQQEQLDDHSQQLDAVRGEISGEIADRTEADQHLQEQIDGQQEQLDDHSQQLDAVRGEISGEIADRTEADQHLQEQIDGQQEQLDDHSQQLDAVRGEISGEIADRTEADQHLQEQIDGQQEQLDDHSQQLDAVRGEISGEIADRTEADKNLQDNIDKVDDKVGDLNYSSHDYVEAGDSATEAIGKLDDALGEVEYKAQQHTTVTTSDSNIQMSESTNANGGTNYDLALNPDLNVDSVTAGDVTINKDDSGTINGLHNTTWTDGRYVSGQAATEDQLHQAIQSNVGDRNYTSTNYVQQGATATDAISSLDRNLAATADQVNANTSAISGLNSRVDTLDGRIDKVGANAAALAALHPLDFDPDDKWDFAAGVGNYGGENAMAVGAFYRPNEDTMFSVGGSFGTGENMVNAGVSFKIGQGNHVSTSRVAMAKEIETLRHNVAQLTELVNKLVGSQDQIQNAMTTPFPDVPENHWAYETIEQMRERGIVEGYPDGTFGGDRQMTRYEFATIVYRAMQKGIGMNEDIQRLVEEFKPELELIRVDTIAQDSEGNPTIERVRVNKA